MQNVELGLLHCILDCTDCENLVRGIRDYDCNFVVVQGRNDIWAVQRLAALEAENRFSHLIHWSNSLHQ